MEILLNVSKHLFFVRYGCIKRKLNPFRITKLKEQAEMSQLPTFFADLSIGTIVPWHVDSVGEETLFEHLPEGMMSGYSEISFEQPRSSEIILFEHAPAEEFWFDQWTDAQEFLLEVLTKQELADLQSPCTGEISLEQPPELTEPEPADLQSLSEEMSIEKSPESVIRTENETR